MTRTVAAGVVSFNYGFVPNGTNQCTFPVTTPGYRTMNGTQVTITPTLSGTNFPSATGAPATLTVTAAAQGSFAKSAPVTIGTGAGMQFSLTIGCGGITGVYSIETLTVTDPLPDNFTFASASVTAPMPGTPTYDPATHTLTYSGSAGSICNGTITVRGFARDDGVPDATGETISNTATATWTYWDGTTGSGQSSTTTRVVPVVPQPFLSKGVGSQAFPDSGQYTFPPDGQRYPYTYPGDWNQSGRSAWYDIGLQTVGTNSGVVFSVKDPMPCLDTLSAQVYSSLPAGGPYCTNPAFIPRLIQATGFTPIASNAITVIHTDGTSAAIPFTPGTGWVIPASPAVAEIDFPPFATQAANTAAQLHFVVNGYSAPSVATTTLLRNTATADAYLIDLQDTPVVPTETANRDLMVVSPNAPSGVVVNAVHGVAYDGGSSCTTSSSLGNGEFATIELGTAPSQAIYFDWLTPAGSTLIVSPNTAFRLTSVSFPTNQYTSPIVTPTIVPDYNGTGRTLYRWVIPAGVIQAPGNYALVTTNNMKLSLGAGCGGTYTSDVTVGYGNPVTACLGSPTAPPPGQKSPNLAVLRANGSPIPGNFCGVVATFAVAPINPAFSVGKTVQGNLDAGPVSAGGVGRVSPDGGLARYDVVFTNTGSTNLKDPVLYDLLPRIGDTQASSSTPRGSEFPVTLTDVGPVPAGVTVSYSTATNPCRPEVLPTNPGCVDDWSTTAPSPIAQTTALRFAYDGLVYVAASANQPKNISIPIEVSTPDQIAGLTAWNTVGSTATAGDQRMPAAESSTTGLTAADQILTLTKAADVAEVQNPAQPGDVITYTFTLTSAAAVTLTDVSISDPLPDLSTLEYTWPGTPGTLAPGQSVTATATYALTQADIDAGQVANTAQGQGTPPTGPVAQSNPASTDTPLAQAAELSIVKSASPSSADDYEEGQLVTYTFVVTNEGNVTLSDVAVDETAFSGTGTLSALDCPAAMSRLDPQEQQTCTAGYTLTQADIEAGEVTNSATATGIAPDETSVTTPPSDALVPIDPAPAISLTKTATPDTASAAGTTITYSFRVTNTGNVSVSDPTIVETAFTGTGSAPEADCPTGSVLPGQFVTCSATYAVTQADVDAGTIANTATAAATAASGDDPTSAPSTATVTLAQTPELSLVKSASAPALEEHVVGETITYSFVVTNTGNVTMTNIAVEEGAFTGSGPLPAPNCPAESALLDPGDQVVCTTSYTVTQADVDHGEIVNTATALGLPPGSETPTPSNPSTITLPESPNPSLTLAKTSDTDTVTAAGQVVRYSFTVMNTGNTTLADPSIVEGAFTGHGALTTPVCEDDGALVPGQTIVCTARYTAVAGDLTGQQLVNTATASATTPSGGDVASDPSTARIPTVTATTSDPLASTGTGWAFSAGVAGIALLVAGCAVLVTRRRQTR
ncbi:putative repeat protein (TIGR01451 family) [Agromyces sp. 3263]|uniref:DUF7507 domain-containing protein n=1 Tax=Agromyces sp. 3263 TaxID=2817750 RepID=UPI00285A3D5E|nr:hypothetical protein [Agromyces sp. 3263]MDR6906595.1 putative repeat protein (TIGR01451 family) [Agromyces sp. 3263]